MPGRAQLLLLLRCCHSWGSFRSAIERHSDQIHILYTPGLHGRESAWEGGRVGERRVVPLKQQRWQREAAPTAAAGKRQGVVQGASLLTSQGRWPPLCPCGEGVHPAAAAACTSPRP